MATRAIFFIYDTESILARMEYFTQALPDLEPLFVVRLPVTAARLRAQGWPALLVSDVLNWEHLLPYRRTLREVCGDAEPTICAQSIDLEEVTRFDQALARLNRDDGAAAAASVQAAEILLRFRSLARYWQPQLVLVWNGWTLPYSPVKALARARGAFCLCGERGLVPDSLVVDSEGVNAGSYLCGPKWEEIARRPIDDNARQIVAEYRRQYAGERQSVVNVASEERPRDLRAEFAIPPGARIVLCPAQLDVDTNPVLFAPHFPTNRSVLEALLAATQGQPHFILFKAHPEDTVDPMRYRDLLGERGRVVPKEIGLHDLMDLTDVVVVRNSTVGFEGLLLGKPVIALGRSVYSHKSLTWDVTNAAELQSALAQARSGMTEAQEENFQRFLAYFLMRYHYYTPARTEWQEEANRVKEDFLQQALRAAKPEWGRASEAEQTFWADYLAIQDEVREVGRRVVLRARESGFAPPRNILIVQATNDLRVISRLIERLRQDLPEVPISFATDRGAALPEEARRRITRHYSLKQPLQAAAVLARKWDLVLYSLPNISHPPRPVYLANRFIRGRTRLIVDDLTRMVALPGSGGWRPS